MSKFLSSKFISCVLFIKCVVQILYVLADLLFVSFRDVCLKKSLPLLYIRNIFSFYKHFPISQVLPYNFENMGLDVYEFRNVPSL